MTIRFGVLKNDGWVSEFREDEKGLCWKLDFRGILALLWLCRLFPCDRDDRGLWVIFIKYPIEKEKNVSKGLDKRRKIWYSTVNESPKKEHEEDML